MYLEIYCPDCGRLRRDLRKMPKQCPDCGNVQAIALNYYAPLDWRTWFEDEPQK